jgi:hypothetical protein
LSVLLKASLLLPEEEYETLSLLDAYFQSAGVLYLSFYGILMEISAMIMAFF